MGRRTNRNNANQEKLFRSTTVPVPKYRVPKYENQRIKTTNKGQKTETQPKEGQTIRQIEGQTKERQIQYLIKNIFIIYKINFSVTDFVVLYYSKQLR